MFIAERFVTAGIGRDAIVVPALESNQTHMFNPQWPAHARLRPVWQLATHPSMGLAGQRLLWFRGNIGLPSAFTCLMFGGLLSSYVTGQWHGGSRVLSDGPEKTVFGFDLGLFPGAISIALAAVAVAMDRRATNQRIKALRKLGTPACPSRTRAVPCCMIGLLYHLRRDPLPRELE